MANPTIPAKADACFNRDLRQVTAKGFGLVAARLLLKKIHARHRDNPDRNALISQHALRRHSDFNLRSCCDQNRFGIGRI